MEQSPESNAAIGYLCLFIGAALALVSAGIIPTDPSQFVAPRWMLTLVGINVMACGGCLLTRKGSLAQLCFIGSILVSFAVMGTWVSVFSADDSIAGGIPFIPRRINIVLARCLFGLGPIVCLWMLWALVKGWLTGKK